MLESLDYFYFYFILLIVRKNHNSRQSKSDEIKVHSIYLLMDEDKTMNI